MYGKLITVISESGMWKGEREESHAFLLSPSVYKITSEQRTELTALGYALAECLRGLSHLAVIAYDAKLNYGGAWTKIRRIFSTGVPKIYRELQGMNIGDIPWLLKVDLMVNQDGHFKIAEIDGHNKHGLGYSTLGKRFRQVMHPQATALPGAVKALAEEVIRLGYQDIKLLYADQERFYIPEFEVVCHEFSQYGIHCHVASEMVAKEPWLQDGLFLDLPFLYKKVNLYEPIVAAYKAGQVQFVIPPKPFLGAKGVMALLRNEGRAGQIEAILQAFTRQKSLELVRSYIPETLLVGKHAEGSEAVRHRVVSKKYVLKESVSSGMKGTVFSDDADFETTLTRASRSNMNWILQEEITNQLQTFSWYDNTAGENTLREADDWFMRVTAQFVKHQLADMIVTARRAKAVHGAKDCIQLGTIVE